MEKLKSIGTKVIAVFSGIAAVAFFFFRVFKARPSSSSDLAEELIEDQKKDLKQQKLKLVQEIEKVEKEELSDKELEDKYNKD